VTRTPFARKHLYWLLPAAVVTMPVWVPVTIALAILYLLPLTVLQLAGVVESDS